MLYENCIPTANPTLSKEDPSPLCFSMSDTTLDATTDAPGIPLPRFDSLPILWEEMSAENRISGILSGLGSECSGRTCAQCGISLGEISTTGRVGCAQCYQSFHELLRSHLLTLHGNNTHKGLMPRAYRERTERLARAAKLRELIQAAVSREAYEEAARLRDELRALERQLH